MKTNSMAVVLAAMLMSPMQAAWAEEGCEKETVAALDSELLNSACEIAVASNENDPGDNDKDKKKKDPRTEAASLEALKAEFMATRGLDYTKNALTKEEEAKSGKALREAVKKKGKYDWSKQVEDAEYRLSSATLSAKSAANWDLRRSFMDGKLKFQHLKFEWTNKYKSQLAKMEEFVTTGVLEKYFRLPKEVEPTSAALEAHKIELMDKNQGLLACQIDMVRKHVVCLQAFFAYDYWDLRRDIEVKEGKDVKPDRKHASQCDWPDATADRATVGVAINKTRKEVEPKLMYPIYKPGYFELKFTQKFYDLSVEQQQAILPQVYYNGYELKPRYPTEKGKMVRIQPPAQNAKREEASLYGHSLSQFFLFDNRTNSAPIGEKDFVILKFAEKTYPNGYLNPYVEDVLKNYVEAVIVNGKEIPIEGQKKYVYKEVEKGRPLEDVYQYTGWKMRALGY